MHKRRRGREREIGRKRGRKGGSSDSQPWSRRGRVYANYQAPHSESVEPECITEEKPTWVKNKQGMWGSISRSLFLSINCYADQQSDGQ